MAVGLYGQALGTVGIELEGTGLDRANCVTQLASRINGRFSSWGSVLTVGRDASVELIAKYLRIGSNLAPLVSTHTRMASKLRGFGDGSSLKKTLGFELITAPLEMAQLQPVIYDTVYGLTALGDFFSNRASTHFHIGFPHNFRMLKNLLRVSLMLEPVLFRLGGMGGAHRGGSNLYAYCRPLMNSACVPVSNRNMEVEAARLQRSLARLNTRRTSVADEPPMPIREEIPLDEGTRFVQVINPLAALEAGNIEEFWACFGINMQNPTAHKYHPTRYTATNFYAIPAHGTIEFRHGNFTRNPALIVAIAKFLRAAVEMSAICGKSEIYKFEPIPSNVEISVSDGVEVISKIIETAREKEVEDLPDDSEMALLVDTLGASSFAELPEQPVLTHIKDFFITNSIVEKGHLRPVQKILAPKHVDIHNITLQSLFD